MKKLIFAAAVTVVLMIISAIVAYTPDTKPVSWGADGKTDAFAVEIPSEFTNYREQGVKAYYYKYDDSEEITGVIMFQHNKKEIKINLRTMEQYAQEVKKEEGMTDVHGSVRRHNGVVGFDIKGYLNVGGEKYKAHEFAFNSNGRLYTIALASSEDNCDDMWLDMMSSLELK